MKWFALIGETLTCIALLFGFVVFFITKDTHNMCFFGILSIITVDNYKEFVKEFIP